jgi:hypothetical protein
MADVFPGATLQQLVEWGFPQGVRRPAPDPSLAFSVIHITGNPGNPIATAAGELAWRLNDPANQNSATFFVDRDGRVYQALSDPLHMDPWSNGDVGAPDMSNPRIAAAVRASVNPNERTLVSIECVGRPTDLPITEAQLRACAMILAHYHGRAGVPITRETVIGHYQVNSITRPNCPAIDKRILDQIVAYAQPEPESRTERLKRERDELRDLKPTAARQWDAWTHLTPDVAGQPLASGNRKSAELMYLRARDPVGALRWHEWSGLTSADDGKPVDAEALAAGQVMFLREAEGESS